MPLSMLFSLPARRCCFRTFGIYGAFYFLLLMRRSHSKSFTGAQGVLKYKLGSGKGIGLEGLGFGVIGFLASCPALVLFAFLHLKQGVADAVREDVVVNKHGVS